MKQYHIYHCTQAGVRFTETENQPRIYAGFVEADSIEEAFQRSQNGGKYNSTNVSEALPWNLNNPCRSTSVGDVIQSDEGFYMVCGIGFRLLDETSKNDSELNKLESQSYEG